MCNNANQITPPAPAPTIAEMNVRLTSMPTLVRPPQDVAGMLLHSRKFWVALFAIVQTIVFALIPGFPEAVWQSIDALCSILIAAYAYNDGAGSPPPP